MQTNHNCSSTFLEFILGSNTVCPGLFTGLTVLILEDVQAFFLHFCRGTFFLFFFSFFFFPRACLQSFAELLGEERTRSQSHAASVHNSGRQIQMDTRKCYKDCCFNQAYRRSQSLLCPLCLYLFFFYEKERNLGANVRHEDTAHSHLVACLAPVEVFFSFFFLVIWLLR